MIKLSVLDLATVCEGASVAQALCNSLRLAQHAEALGLHRFWLAEHHSLPGVASAATAVVMSHVAGGTHAIRVGAGGIMLPNHAPLVIAEQFGTLASLFPGRIDLGLGRAPGSSALTQQALRRSPQSADHFVEDLRELQHWFRQPQPGQRVVAVPGAGLDVPLWVLGSSTFGARVAAEFGLPYAFASHFAPAQLEQAVDVYRRQFKPSPELSAPHLMLALNVVAADTDAQARRLFTSLQRAFLNLSAGRPGLFPAPSSIEPDGQEQYFLEQALSASVVGSPTRVAAGLARFVERYRPQELIVAVPVYDFEARLHSLQLTAQAAQDCAAGQG